MKSIVLLAAVLLLNSFSIQAQKKSELINQNQELKFQLDSIKRLVSDAQRNERIGLLKADELQSQVTELQDANATLMKNLNSFAALSSQNSENINKTLATLERKEAQLKGLVDGFASNDSTALVILTKAKQSLGENAKIQVSDGEVIVSEKLDFFFENGSGNTLMEPAKSWLENVAKIINDNPTASVSVIGMNITGELNLGLDQASAVAGALIKEYTVKGDRLDAQGLDGGFKESLQIRIRPNYKAFYEKAKEDMKN